jgi:hypothetical protein
MDLTTFMTFNWIALIRPLLMPIFHARSYCGEAEYVYGNWRRHFLMRMSVQILPIFVCCKMIQLGDLG